MSGLDAFFAPQSIAFVGASMDPSKWGTQALLATQAAGYRGTVYCVNPRYDGQQICGAPCYGSLSAVRGPVDLAVLSMPAAAAAHCVRDCAVSRVQAAVVWASDSEDVGLTEAMSAVARDGQVRLLGPNCMGVADLGHGVMATWARLLTFDLGQTRRGPVAYVTQSGAAIFILERLCAHGLGFDSYVSTGNEADATFADFARHQLAQDGVGVLGGYLESIRDPQGFLDMARDARRRHKPVVILKAGRSDAGARAALSHTGSIGGDYEVTAAVLRHESVVQVDTLDELEDALALFSCGRRPSGRRVGIASMTGGGGVVTADACRAHGFDVPMMSASGAARLRRSLGVGSSPDNPVDVGSISAGDLARCVDVMDEDSELDIVIAYVIRSRDTGETFLERVATPSNRRKLLVVVLESGHDEIVSRFQTRGIPTFADPMRAVRALTHLIGFHSIPDRPALTAPVAPSTDRVSRAAALVDGYRSKGRRTLTEVDCQALLRAYGLRVPKGRLVRSADAAVEAARQTGFPVVVKLQSPDVPHKTEISGIEVGVATSEALRQAYERVLAAAATRVPDAAIDGVLVQEMVRGGQEVVVGVKRDPTFGPVVAFGAGGVHLEVLRDVSFGLPPLSEPDAQALIERTVAWRILQGVRNQTWDVAALRRLLLTVGELAVDLRNDLSELDLNPVFVLPAGQGVCVGDALAVLRAC